MEDQRPKVGLGVIILKDNNVLLGKRKNAHGKGDWCFPGGHLEFNESLEDCAIREVSEETGINIKNIKPSSFTNDIFKKENKHYVTLFMLANYDSGEAKVMEPEKCEKWEWFKRDELPENLFLPIQNLLKQNRNPLNYKQ